VDRALAYEASLECIRNSKQLLDDGRVLFQKKSYGHTFALLVLAEENSVKPFSGSCRRSGLISRREF